VGRRRFFFSKKIKVRSMSPTTIATDNAMSTISPYTTHTDNAMSDEGIPHGNCKNERQGSEASALTTISRRHSPSDLCSEGNAIFPQHKGKTSESTITLRRSSSSTKLTEGEGSQLSSDGSITSSQSDGSEKIKTLHGIFNLRESLCSIQDNFYSTITDEPPRCSTHMNEEGGKKNLNCILEDLEMQLMIRTAAIEEGHLDTPLPPSNSPSHSSSQIALKISPDTRSILAPVPEKTSSLRTVTPEPVAPTQSKPQPLTRTRNRSDADSFHLTPTNRDLSLEDNLSSSVLSTDLSMDEDSLTLETPHEGIVPRLSIGNAPPDVHIELNAELSHIDVRLSRPTIISTDASINLDSLPQDIPHGNDVLCQSMDNILYDLPREVDDELRQVHIISTTTSSGCRTMSSGSSIEDVGHMIRSRMLNGSDFNSNYNSSSETISDTHSLEEGSVIRATPYQRLDDTVMDDLSQISSTDSSYQFVESSLKLLPIQSKPQPLTRIRNRSDADSFHLTPINRDLSLEDTLSSSVLPADLSMDMGSLALEAPHEGIDPRLSIGNAPPDVHIELNADLLHVHVKSQRPAIINLPPQEMPHGNDELRQPMENILYDLPREVDDELCQIRIISRPTSASSGCRTMSSGCRTMSSGCSIEDVGHMIRSRILNGSDFDSNYSSSSETISDTHSLEKGSAIKAIPYQRLDDTVMDNLSQISSTDSSYDFVNLPLELQNDHVAMDLDDDSNSDSEGATASSNDDIAYLEDLCSNTFSKEEEESFTLIHPISPNEEEFDLPSVTLAMLGLFKDDESCNSSVVSSENTGFLEDDQFNDQSEACCSISMHDITTIHEENEDDIAEEEYLSPMEDKVDQNLTPIPLNGDLHLQKMEITSQGTGSTDTLSHTISSITDESYMRGMSFDSSSDRKEGSRPRGFYRKTTGWKDVMNIDSYQDTANDDQSLISFSDSAWSLPACSYDSFSSKLVNYMVDILKDEAERKRSKIKEQIAKIRESADKVNNINEYVSSRLLKGRDEDSTLS